ncbi:hypothetical protein Q3G72_001911 [Acer saccharum]|nr:hypothetical protein Q3G72_001911 [Acer saccharum]
MMGLEQVTDSAKNAQPGQGLSPSASNAAAAKEQFLSLLVAQISHQNPMKPMDDKDLITQLAQFSSVEQAIETNTRLGALQESQAAASRINMASLVGKEGIAQTNMLHIENGKTPSPITYTLEGIADNVTIRMVDSEGTVAHSIKTGGANPGAHALPWDGRLATGNTIAAGDYAVHVSASDKFGNTVPVSQEVRGKITGIDLNGAEPFVRINGIKIRTSDVTQLNG